MLRSRLPRIARPGPWARTRLASFATVQAATDGSQDLGAPNPNSNETAAFSPISYSLHSNKLASQEPYWRSIPRWRDTTPEQFISHKWQMANTVQSEKALYEFLFSVLPKEIKPQTDMKEHLRITNIHNADDFTARVREGISKAPMAVRLSPYILSSIDWSDPVNDPVRRQFLPLSSPMNVTHPAAVLDPMKENTYSPVSGLIHRYPDKALFFGKSLTDLAVSCLDWDHALRWLAFTFWFSADIVTNVATSICPVYCRFCFRSYTVGTETETVKKQRVLPVIKKWESRFQYIENTPTLKDITISGGDSYLLEPSQLKYIGERLLSIPHIRRFRFASKGLAVSPSRLIDGQDEWVNTIIELEKKARRMGKHICIHTHFNSVKEISWVTRMGAQRLYEAGVTVRNQTVLLNGVNNTTEKMCALVQALGDMNIQPYYVYQGDVVPGAEDLRTPMQDSLDLETAVRGQTAGFLIPSFILDVPAEGGKRLTRGVKDYDHHIGLSKLTAPGLKGEPTTFEYWDPLWSLSEQGRAEVLRRFGKSEADLRT